MFSIKSLITLAMFFFSAMNYIPATATAKASAADSTLDQRVTLFHNQAKDLDNKVLRLALRAYTNAKVRGEIKKPYVTIIDYSKKSNKKRLWVLDLKRNLVTYHTFVAHGKGSGTSYANHFSNQVGSHESSLGVFVTGNTYASKHGISLHLDGKDKGYNDNAGKRAVVMHGAWYTSPAFIAHNGYAGRSWGCPAIPQSIASTIMHTIKNGSMIFAYYPNQAWLTHSKYLA